MYCFCIKLLCFLLGSGIGSTWFLSGSETWPCPGVSCFASIPAWFQPWFHLVPTWFHTAKSHRVLCFRSSLPWFRPGFHLVSCRRSTNVLVSSLVPRGSNLVLKHGYVPAMSVLRTFMLVSSLGSTWFRQGSTSRNLTEQHIFQTVCWLRRWFHLVPTCFRKAESHRAKRF